MSTISVIVDAEDTVIGHKRRSDVQPDNIYRVSLLWIVNDAAQVLLAQRALTKEKDPGVWGSTAAGTVELGETYETNVIKEAKEELGLDISGVTPGPKQRVSGTFNYFCQHFIYHGHPDLQGLTLQTEEVAAVRWMDIDDLATDIADHPERYGFKFEDLYGFVMPHLT